MNQKLRILALEAYYGGSHKAFLDAWIARSRHEWIVYQLPPYKWKWRMRHSAITFANRLSESGEAEYDLIYCSDMTNLAEFRGLASLHVANLPALLYFHENQLTYPTAKKDPRDHHYAFTNLISALSADAVWFNSEHHRASLLDALAAFLKRMPDFHELASIERIRIKSQIWPPGTETIERIEGQRQPGPIRIVWAARWEDDKNPDDFFAAMFQLDEAGFDFRLTVLGESFKNVPPVFEEAKTRLAHRIDQWGYLPTRADYVAALQNADIMVSTALHEFFGISVVEGISAGAIPILPNRLSYPEILSAASSPIRELCLFDGRVSDLVTSITKVAEKLADPEWRARCQAELMASTQRFRMAELAPTMDRQLERLVSGR